MQVEAIYDHGRLEFVEPLRLKHERVRVRVEVPDEELASEVPEAGPQADVLPPVDPEVERLAQSMRAALDAIHARAIPDDLPEPSERYLERAAAFAWREDR